MIFGGMLQERRWPIYIDLSQSNSIFQPCCRKILFTTCLFSHIHSIKSEFSEGGVKRKLRNERKFTNNQKGDRQTSHSVSQRVCCAWYQRGYSIILSHQKKRSTIKIPRNIGLLQNR